MFNRYILRCRVVCLEMKISEKQIMSLMTIARTYAESLREKGLVGEIQSYQVLQLLDRINSQQSEELKDVE
jgi:hypothetical protein